MQNNEYYKNIITNLEIEKGNSTKKINLYSIVRLIVFVLLIIAIIYAFNTFFLIGIIFTPISIFLFALLVNYHNKKEEELNKYSQLIEIYENEIRDSKADNVFGVGNEYINHLHMYTSDLDVFGRFSLFGLLNRTVTTEGRNILANWLQESSGIKLIKQRQEAVKELVKKIPFKEEFLRTFFYSKAKESNINLKTWIEKFEPHFVNRKFLIVFSYISPVMIIASFVVGYLFPLVWLFTFVLIAINTILLIGNQLAVNKIDVYVSKQSNVFKRYSKLVSIINKESFSSELTANLKLDLVEKYNPEEEFKKMARISRRFDNRPNIFYRLFIFPVFLNEFHMSLKAEKWFIENKKNINSWTSIIGEFDALLSLSILSYNNAEWIYPDIVDSEFIIEGNELGHPLINKDVRVVNSYNIKGQSKADIVTGSNMAGKSTFLRTVAVNMIIAYTGAPVCAKSLKLSKIRILTYFRIHDSLEESTSSFYAELKRIKQILIIIKTDNNCLLLLDELLRGTNTIDRNLGSVAIIKQFLKYNAVGIVATHDLSIADMKEDFPEQIRNFNFDVNVKNDELFFDYKLKDGICSSFNATLLMKKIGIDFDI